MRRAHAASAPGGRMGVLYKTPASGVGHRSPTTGVLAVAAGAPPAASQQGETCTLSACRCARCA
eukprot:3698444-Alexandrium_andersonii.AAC.1